MRLREIQNILGQADLRDSNLLFQPPNALTNLINFKGFISIIKAIPIYQSAIETLEASEIFTTTSDTLTVNEETQIRILSIATYVSQSAYALLKVSEYLIDTLEAEEISIKLANTSDLGVLINDINNINKAITQIILNEKINGRLEIRSLETGSKWINLYLGSILAVSITASVAWSGAVVYKKIQEGKLFSEYARGLAVKNDALQEIAEKQSEALSTLVDEEAKRIQVEFYDDDKDNENFERIKYSIKLFSELIEKGTEVHPALNAPEDVKNLFPDFGKLEFVTSKKKLLSE
jgi:hypothetical protein